MDASSKLGASTTDGGEQRHPFWAKCEECQHIWTALYLPMDVRTFGKMMKTIHCPMCGVDAKRITPARKNDVPKP